MKNKLPLPLLQQKTDPHTVHIPSSSCLQQKLTIILFVIIQFSVELNVLTLSTGNNRSSSPAQAEGFSSLIDSVY